MVDSLGEYLMALFTKFGNSLVVPNQLCITTMSLVKLILSQFGNHGTSSNSNK